MTDIEKVRDYFKNNPLRGTSTIKSYYGDVSLEFEWEVCGVRKIREFGWGYYSPHIWFNVYPTGDRRLSDSMRDSLKYELQRIVYSQCRGIVREHLNDNDLILNYGGVNIKYNRTPIYSGSIKMMRKTLKLLPLKGGKVYEYRDRKLTFDWEVYGFTNDTSGDITEFPKVNFKVTNIVSDYTHQSTHSRIKGLLRSVIYEDVNSRGSLCSIPSGQLLLGQVKYK